jgi:hypothetical protein
MGLELSAAVTSETVPDVRHTLGTYEGSFASELRAGSQSSVVREPPVLWGH